MSTPTGPAHPHAPLTPRTFRPRTADEELKALQTQFVGTTTLDSYDHGVKLGEGTFGVVTKAVEKVSKQLVALKKLIMHNERDGVSVTTVREIKILKALDHPNVVPIRDMVVDRTSKDGPIDYRKRGEVFMVFPFMDHDLCGLLGNQDFKMTHSLAKLLFKQILEGMAYIHAHNFIHRDIKTANILVDKRGNVMIADFGLARTWTPGEDLPPHMATEYTNMVVTRWYRAPELLLGDVHYTPAVDMWSLGCVLGEMYHRQPILAGESDRDQLFKIFSRCGPLNGKTFPEWSSLPGFPDAKGHPWDLTPMDTPMRDMAHKWQMDRPGTDLMMKLLTLDPKTRYTAEQALTHPWFWIAPKPASHSDNLIKVESSHEMTTRQRQEPVAAKHPPAAMRHPVAPPVMGRAPFRPQGGFPNGRGPPGPGPGPGQGQGQGHFGMQNPYGGGGGGGGDGPPGFPPSNGFPSGGPALSGNFTAGPPGLPIPNRPPPPLSLGGGGGGGGAIPAPPMGFKLAGAGGPGMGGMGMGQNMGMGMGMGQGMGMGMGQGMGRQMGMGMGMGGGGMGMGGGGGMGMGGGGGPQRPGSYAPPPPPFALAGNRSRPPNGFGGPQAGPGQGQGQGQGQGYHAGGGGGGGGGGLKRHATDGMGREEKRPRQNVGLPYE